MIPRLSSFNAEKVLRDGNIIIYPTEGIYGIGCDALNHDSVNKVITIKGRSIDKNFILICSNVMQLINIICNDYMNYQELLKKDFITWIVPASKKCPSWLTVNNTVAVRITKHPVVENLCNGIQRPIISTSANYSNEPYINDIERIENLFDKKVDYIIEGELGGEIKSSTIKDIETREVLRN